MLHFSLSRFFILYFGSSEEWWMFHQYTHWGLSLESMPQKLTKLHLVPSQKKETTILFYNELYIFRLLSATLD